MIMPKTLIREVQRIQEGGPSRLYKVRMDRSERSHPFSERFIENIKKKLDGELLMTYPEPGPLYERFSTFLKQSRERLLFHTGSDLCIKAVFETYINSGDKVLFHRPGYAMYSVYSKIYGVEAVYQDFDSDLNFNYEKYIDTIDSTFRMAVLENPNGFIGVAPPKNMLFRFIEKCEENEVIALIDEAYFFFHNITATDLLNTCENLIVVRTFSKAFGLAGLRAGYILSRKENIENIYKVKPMHELNSFVIFAIDELLNNPQEVFDFVKVTSKNLQYFKDGFAELGIETSKSVGNFLAARLGKFISATEFSARLQGEGFLLRRPFAEPHLKEWVRIGTAPIEYERRVLDVVKDMMGKA